jgi:RNA polymerase sigma-70 factor (ECF subfamily)
MSLGDVYASHADAVRALARRRLGDAAEADDVTAATFTALMDLDGPHRRDARPPEVRSFVLAVCGNLIKRFRRARARRAEVHARFAEETPRTVDSLERAVMHRELTERLGRALESLSDEQRTTVLLAALEDHSAADIATLTGVPEATVRTRLHHARRKLRDALDPPSRTRRGLLVGAAVVLLLALFAFGPRALAAPFVAVYHAVLHAMGLDATGVPATPRLPAPRADAPAMPSLAREAVAAPAAPSALSAPSAPSAPSSTAVAPTERRAPPAHREDPLRAEYLRAHQAQFAAHDYESALHHWDAYLARAGSSGAFLLEARYNRAIALAHLDRIDEARAALAPFAAGMHGDYRQRDAQRLLDLLPAR